ncbi:MAG TPA: FHA domain-containing protein [Ktedonobacterales bacterium]|nr:FHA domain-containing protein [Ktedonobacterales bacterium]
MSIRFLTGPLDGQTFLIEKPVVTIGRDLANDIAISTDLQVSRQHARLTWTGAAWRIENISRANFIQIDGQDTQQAILSSGAVVSLGETSSFTTLPAEAGVDDASKTVGTVGAVGTMGTMATALASDPPPAPDQATAARITAAPARSDQHLTIDSQRSPVDATEIARLDGALPSLEVSSTTRDGKVSYPLTSAVISIGRAATNDIVINDRVVSAHHLQIVREGNDYLLIHPHPERPSTLNGLLYQGRKIRGDEHFTKRLAKGDVFRIGNEDGTLVTLTFHDGTDTAQVAAPPVEPIRLGAEELTIGRHADNTVVLAHPQVSGRHARLTREGSTYRITDLNSTNHVYVNGEIVASQLLKTGDAIYIGPYRLVYDGNQLTQYDESKFIQVTAVGLKKYGANGVTLLDDITLAIPPRSFVALVGGSGAGKSTLLDALNGLRPAQKGAVLYNGQDYYKNMAVYSTQIGYVPQDDIVHRDLTVERALYYAAKLRLPGDFTEDQIERRIDEVLEEVELTHRRTLMVRDLSGGQRKRVSIALELLANPSIFFLDEPTSGLDPGLDRKMMFLLRNLADRGHTIVLVTHATNNINACDYVCFLAAGGRLAFFGPPEEAKTAFGKSDFAEIYTSLEPTDESPAIPADAQARFRTSPEYARYIAEPVAVAVSSANGHKSAPPPPGQRPGVSRRGHGWSQFLLLSRRYTELLWNDRVNLLILLLQAPIIALMLVLMLRFEIGAGIFNANALTQCRTQIVTSSGGLTLPQAQQGVVTDCKNALAFLKATPTGTAYAQAHGGANQALQDFIIPGPGADAQKALFIMAFATILFGCINGAREFVKEAPIYRRERAVNLGIAPYMFSKITVLGVLCLFQSLVFVVIVQLGEPLQQGIFTSPTVEAFITLAFTSVAGLMFGLAISAIAPNTDRAISFVPIILLPQVIFSGAIIPLKDWVTQILATVFPSRWAMAALGSTIGLHAETVGGDRLFGSDYTYHGTLFSIYSQADALGRLVASWAALLIIIVALTILIAVVLKRKDAQR